MGAPYSSCGNMIALYRKTCVAIDREYFLVHLQAIRFQFLLAFAILCSVCSRKFNLSSIWMPRDVVDDLTLQRFPFITIAGCGQFPTLKTNISVLDPFTTIRQIRHQLCTSFAIPCNVDSSAMGADTLTRRDVSSANLKRGESEPMKSFMNKINRAGENATLGKTSLNLEKW